MNNSEYECSKCSAKGSKSKMEEHFILNHVSLDRVPWSCSLCNFKSTTKTGLNRHEDHKSCPAEIAGYVESKIPYDVIVGVDICPDRDVTNYDFRPVETFDYYHKSSGVTADVEDGDGARSTGRGKQRVLKPSQRRFRTFRDRYNAPKVGRLYLPHRRFGEYVRYRVRGDKMWHDTFSPDKYEDVYRRERLFAEEHQMDDSNTPKKKLRLDSKQEELQRHPRSWVEAEEHRQKLKGQICCHCGCGRHRKESDTEDDFGSMSEPQLTQVDAESIEAEEGEDKDTAIKETGDNALAKKQAKSKNNNLERNTQNRNISSEKLDTKNNHNQSDQTASNGNVEQNSCITRIGNHVAEDSSSTEAEPGMRHKGSSSTSGNCAVRDEDSSRADDLGDVFPSLEDKIARLILALQPLKNIEKALIAMDHNLKKLSPQVGMLVDVMKESDGPKTPK